MPHIDSFMESGLLADVYKRNTNVSLTYHKLILNDFVVLGLGEPYAMRSAHSKSVIGKRRIVQQTYNERNKRATKVRLQAYNKRKPFHNKRKATNV